MNARFGHSPDPVLDYVKEVDRLVDLVSNENVDHDTTLSFLAAAATFPHGQDPRSVLAKRLLDGCMRMLLSNQGRSIGLNPGSKQRLFLREQTLRFTYTNYRGEVSVRTVTPMEIIFGSTKWHPDDQWLMRALDRQKWEERLFALNEMTDLVYI
jgi:hypothetical protein